MDELPFLESLIVEFYETNISNERRKEIESNLLCYENGENSWKNCIQYVQCCQNILVRSFCLKVIENTICKRWSKMSEEDKIVLRTSLYSYLFNFENDIPSLIAKHLMKLLAKIARNEWPTVRLTFLNDVINIILANDSKMVLLGLSSLLIAAEELVNPQEEICSTRKFEIKQQFESYVPHIFLVLNGTLQKYKHSNAEEEIYKKVFNTYSQLFSWLPLSDFYTLDLLSPIFDCIDHKNLQIRISALAALNEILYKNCVPSTCIPLIACIFKKLNDILHQIVKSDVSFETEELVTKITEMVSLVFSIHWHRIEMNVDADTFTSFLSSFYTVSFHRASLQYYVTCLEIWCNFLEYLTMRNANHVKQYENLLFTLLQEIFHKLYTKSTNDWAQQPDDSDVFFNQHMNIIDLITGLLSQDAFKLIFDAWNSSKIAYIQLLASKEPCDMLTSQAMIETLRRFEASTQILTSLHSKIDSSLNATIVLNLKEIVNFANKNHACSKIEGDLFCHHMLRVHCQLMKSVPTWVCFSAEKDDLEIVDIFSSTLPFISESHVCNYPELQISAAYLVAHLIGCLKQTSILQPLFMDPTFKYLPIEGQRLLQCALFSWVCNCKTESYEDKLKFLRHLFETVTSKNIENLENITKILCNSKINQSEGKDVLFGALEPWLEHIIEEYPSNFSKNSRLCKIFILFLLEAFRILRDHVNSIVIQKVLFMLDKCFRSNINFYDEHLGIDKMMMLLITLIENTGPTCKDYISNVISITEKVYLLIEEKPNAAFAPEFYKLLYCVLLNKWPYFHKGSEINEKLLLHRRTEFEKLLFYVLESFKHSDVHIFKNSLLCLEEMNLKWNLYNRELFRMKYRPMVLCQLLNILTLNTHKLLADDILTAVYHMAVVDFETFFNAYIPLFLVQIPGLTQHQVSLLKQNISHQTDMPSFVQEMSTLINDTRSYQVENGYI